MNEVIVNESNFEKEVIKSKTPVLIDFWAVWCGPCRMLAPELSSISEKYANKLKVVKINVDDNENIAARFGVNSIPALFYMNGNEIVKSSVGFMQQDEIENYFGLKTL
jgi:thioredoxin 1